MPEKKNIGVNRLSEGMTKDNPDFVNISHKLEIKEKESGAGRLNIDYEGEMSIYTVKDIAASLVKGLNNYSEMTINLSRVSRIDTAGFQMLLMARKDSERMKKGFHMRNPSDEVWRVFDLCGYQYNFEE